MNITSNGFSCHRLPVNSLDDQTGNSLSILHSAVACSNSDSNSRSRICALLRFCALGSYSFEGRRKSAHARPTSQAKHLHRTLRLLAALFIFSPLQAQTMIEGSAIVTSRSGSVSAINASGERVSTASHEILHPVGLTLSTKKDARIFLTFSNGVAVALNEASVVQCIDYTQRPFDKEDQALDLEPSESNLKLRLIDGQIALASSRLSPISDLRIQLPKGELRLHKGTCLISLDATGLHITAYEGNLTYYYPDNKSREFVSAPKGIRISDQSMERQRVAKASTVESLEVEQIRFCQAAQHASKRVTFQANDSTRLPPKPVLIVRPPYFQQPYFRPYQFKE